MHHPSLTPRIYRSLEMFLSCRCTTYRGSSFHPSSFWIEWQTINNHGQIMFSPARLVLSLIKLRWSRELWSQTRTRATCYTSQQNSYQCDEYLHCTAPNMMSVKSRGSSSDSDVDRSCIQSSTEPGMRITIVRFPCSSWRTHQSNDTPWLTEEIYLDFALCNLWRAYSHPNCRPNRSEVPSSTCWSSHGHATHPMSTNESTHTSLSHSTNVVELDSEVFDSEVLRLPTTSLRLGYHKFGSSWLGSAGCQSPDRIRLCPSWLSFYGFSVIPVHPYRSSASQILKSTREIRLVRALLLWGAILDETPLWGSNEEKRVENTSAGSRSSMWKISRWIHALTKS